MGNAPIATERGNLLFSPHTHARARVVYQGYDATVHTILYLYTIHVKYKYVYSFFYYYYYFYFLYYDVSLKFVVFFET